MEQLRQEVKVMLDQFNELSEDMKSMSRDIHDIKNILSGFANVKDDKGLIGLVKSNEEKIGKLERWKDRSMYFIYGLCIASGFGVASFLKQIFG